MNTTRNEITNRRSTKQAWESWFADPNKGRPLPHVVKTLVAAYKSSSKKAAKQIECRYRTTPSMVGPFFFVVHKRGVFSWDSPRRQYRAARRRTKMVALGPKSTVLARSAARSERRQAELAERLQKGTPKRKKDVAFIPGSGNEKLLIKSRGQNLSELPPLSFNRVSSNRDVKSQIERDKKDARRNYKKARWTDKQMKKVLGLSSQARSLVLDYADMRLVKPVLTHDLVLKEGDPNQPTSESRMSRDSLSMSVVDN